MPARLRDLVRALAEHGIDVQKPKKGSHWRAVRDGRTYPIPAHNGEKTEIPDTYVNGVCRAFELDADAVKKAL